MAAAACPGVDTTGDVSGVAAGAADGFVDDAEVDDFLLVEPADVDGWGISNEFCKDFVCFCDVVDDDPAMGVTVVAGCNETDTPVDEFAAADAAAAATNC